MNTLLETAAKTLETDFEDADSDFVAVQSEEMERCKNFILALSRAKEQLGLAPLSNRDEINAWLDYAIEEAREVQDSYEFDEDEIPIGGNGEPLCSELYLDELACEVFGNICFEFNGNETYFANHIAATAERIAKQMTDDLNNSVIPNEDIILSFIAVFEEISSHVPADMIQSEADEFEELDESDPDYAEKHTLLLEAFTDMDKNAHYTGINNGMFMGTLTGPDIRVESMRITAYTPNSYTKKKTMYVTKDGAYVTATPNGTVIAALGRGTAVSAGEAEYHSGIWYSITFVLTNGDTRSGWMAGIYLSETEVKLAPGTGTIGAKGNELLKDYENLGSEYMEKENGKLVAILSRDVEGYGNITYGFGVLFYNTPGDRKRLKDVYGLEFATKVRVPVAICERMYQDYINGRLPKLLEFTLDNNIWLTQNQIDALVMHRFLVGSLGEKTQELLKVMFSKTHSSTDLKSLYRDKLFSVLLEDIKDKYMENGKWKGENYKKEYEKYEGGWTNRILDEIELFFDGDGKRNH